MKATVKVPYITEELENLVDDINREIELINCLSRQIIHHQNEVKQLIEEKQNLPNIQNEWRKEISKEASIIGELYSKRRDINSQINNLKPYQVKKRAVLQNELNVVEAELSYQIEQISDKQARRNAKRKLIMGAEERIKNELLPNIKHHLKQLYSSIRSYAFLAERFKLSTRVKLPAINPDFIKKNDDGVTLPIVVEEQDIPLISLQWDHWSNKEEEWVG